MFYKRMRCKYNFTFCKSASRTKRHLLGNTALDSDNMCIFNITIYVFVVFSAVAYYHTIKVVSLYTTLF